MEVLGRQDRQQLPAPPSPDQTAPVQLERKGDVGVLWLGGSSGNVLSAAVRNALAANLRAAAAMPGLVGLVIASAGSDFAAGADLREMERESPLAGLRMVAEAIESCILPVVAAMRGQVLGAGLELALACDGRVCAEDAILRMPQVLLGSIPGAGGTQLLPRLTGRAAALEIICSGRSVPTAEALLLGLVDEVVQGTLLEAALKHARALAPFKNRVRSRPVLSDDEAFAQAVAQVRALHGKWPSTEAAIEAVAASATQPTEAAMELERQLHESLRTSPQARALRYQFFARRRLDAIRPHGTKRLESALVGVVGAGELGARIAGWLLDAGLQVIVADSDRRALQAAGKLLRPRGVRLTGDLRDLAPVDFVIEAVTEDYDVKAAVFIALDEILRRGCVIATTSSSVDLDVLAAVTHRAEFICGMHFIPSAEGARVVEVVRSTDAAASTLAGAAALAARMGMLPVVVGNAFGFIGNRIQFAVRDACARMAQDGASPKQLGRALRGFGFSESLVSAVLPSALASDVEPAAGAYPTDEKIVDQVLLTLANEAACLLEDGVAAAPSDIDVLLVDAYGFPAWEGGPAFWTRHKGLQGVTEARDSFLQSASPSRRGPLALLVSDEI
jgi:3-hydroxyacyl-CoA dehydrogenase